MSLSNFWQVEKFSFFAESSDSPVICTKLTLKRGKAAVIAVSDNQGELIALLRMDWASVSSVVIATNKAWTAAREGKPTYDLGQSARDPETGFDMGYYGDRRYVGWGGGIPVIHEGKVIGAIAVSGLVEGEDIELAKLGRDSLGMNE